jgi:hypothetical protein
MKKSEQFNENQFTGNTSNLPVLESSIPKSTRRSSQEEYYEDETLSSQQPKSQMFPPISQKSHTSHQSLHVSYSNSPSRGQTHYQQNSELIIPESGVVVGTRNLTQKTTNTTSSSQGLNNIEEWKQQEFILSGPDVEKTKLGWENDIARHILSLYATTHALKNLKDSNSLLDFVGEKPKGGTLQSQASLLSTRNDDDLEFNDNDEKMFIDTKTPQFKEVKKTRKPVMAIKGNAENAQYHQTIQEGENEHDEYENFENTKQEREQKPKKKKLKKLKKSKSGTSSSSQQDQSHLSHLVDQAEQRQKNQEFINNIIDKLENSMTLSKQKDRYRIVNAIKTKDGQEIIVRGSPKCCPIWFVASGELYVDWTKLPGGKRLQSHLSVLYENQYYLEYLNIIQTMLVTYWREKNFGKEEYTLGNFGKSDTANSGGLSSNSSTANRPNSRASKKGSSSAGSSTATSPNKPKSSQQGSVPSSSSSRKPSSQQEQQLQLQQQQKQSSHGDSRVATANTLFSRHYSEPNILQRSPSQPKVTFYENLLNDKIDSNIRTDIESKVELYNHQKASFDFQDNHNTNHPSQSSSASSPSFFQNSNLHLQGASTPSQEEEFAYNKLTLKEIEGFWKQLILTTIAIGVLCIEKKQYEKGMKFFIMADDWANNDDLIPSGIERRLYRAHVKDAMSYYFFKRERFIAAMAYSTQAMEVFEKYCEYDPKQTTEAIGMCLLHIASTYCQMSKFKDSHKVSL